MLSSCRILPLRKNSKVLAHRALSEATHYVPREATRECREEETHMGTLTEHKCASELHSHQPCLYHSYLPTPMRPGTTPCTAWESRPKGSNPDGLAIQRLPRSSRIIRMQSAALRVQRGALHSRLFVRARETTQLKRGPGNRPRLTSPWSGCFMS